MKTTENDNDSKPDCVITMLSHKLKIYFCIACLISLMPGIGLKAITNDTISPWSVLMAENLMKNPSIASGPSLQSYVFATALKGLRELWKATEDSAYLQYISEIVDDNLPSYEGLAGMTYYDMDFINGASLILFMYSQTGDSKYVPAIDSTLKYLNSMPRTSDGGIYHKGTTSYRLQLDDLYMIGPFMAEYGILFNQPEVYQDAVRQALLFKKYMRDTITGLMYHAWYDGEHAVYDGCTPYFWGRGIGWVIMGLVDMLDFLPEDYTGRDSIILMYQDLADAISNAQDDESNVWWQVVDKPSIGNNYQESSASCMFVYAIAKGIRLGYPDNSYLPVVEKGIQGIMDTFLEIVDESTINILDACPGQGPSFDLNNYFGSTAKNVHAVGPFIGASLETSGLNIFPVSIAEDKLDKEILMSNYPNPFSGVTTIKLTLPETEFITLDVYNILGQRVERLYEGIKPAGNCSFTFDSSGKGSGVYLCRFQAKNKALVKNMLVIK
jgi:unsaturated rhamnogalacturonyl hydrolase